MYVMEGVILCVHLLILQQAVLPVTAQVTLQTEGTFVEGSAATFNCLFTGAWNPASLRQWVGPGSVAFINKGASVDAAKYTETIDSANNRFSMTIQNYNSGDEGSYRCLYGFDTSNTITLSKSNTEVHPSPPPLPGVVIPVATKVIDLTISVPGIRPDASASFNLTSSTGTPKPAGTGSAVVTVTDDGNARTSSSSLKIDVPAGTTSTGDIFTITLVVGTYSETKQWTIAATTTTPASSSSSCDSCTTINVLAALGIVFAVVCIVFCWMVYLQRSGKFQGPCSVFTKSKCSVKQTLIAAIIATSLCVIGIILCIVGLVTLIVALAVVGFVLPVFTHVIVIILLTFFCCGKIMEKDGDNKAVRARPDGQEGSRPPIDTKPRTERTPRSAGSPTSASNIKTKWRNNQVSDSNESDGSNDTPRRKLEAVPQGRKLPALELVDASQKANTLEPMEINEIKKLKKKKKRRSKEEKAQVDGEY